LLLALAQALMLSVNSLMVTSAAIIGSYLATNKALATLPLQAGFSAGHADRPRRGGLRRHRNLPGVISAVLYRHHRHGYVHRIW
jgi:hypothetical protein